MIGKKAILWLAFTLAVAPDALGGVLYDQPASSGACACWTSSVAGGNGYQSFDNFQLSSPGNINAVTWQGLYADYLTLGNNPVGPDTVSWDIEFWSNNAGLPGTLLYDQNLLASQVTTTFLGTTNDLGAATNVYAFSASLPSGFSAGAGTEYWFSVLSNQSTFDPIFSWTLGTGEDSITQQEPLGSFGSGFIQQPGDRVFSLQTVPEPGTLGALLVGLGTLAFLKRRTA
jgi:hypothetical protein